MTDRLPGLPSTVLAALLLLAACSRPADVPAATAPQAVAASMPTAPGIAWQHATTDADIDAAFAQARRESRPVFVYWGAKWCPPCNQVKATLFNRQDFIERSRAFVPVYVDGDSPGAQRLGARIKVSGYPTMVLLSAQGTELTRLPGEVDPARYTEVLTLGMNDAQKPVGEVLAQALAGGSGLTPNDWRFLAFYSWDTAEPQRLPPGGRPAMLKTLAAACPAALGDVARRLQLQALAATETPPPAATPASLAALRQLLADPAASKAQTDVLVASAADIVRAAGPAGTPARAELLSAVDAALVRLQNDATLSRADRMAALYARVDLVRIDVAKNAGRAARPPVPAALLADLRAAAARDDREITDGYERQAVVTAAADTLAEAGLADESTALLKANLSKSHSPYYLMSMLSKQAKDRGDAAEAIDWSARAFDASEGPATRLQWGAGYVSTLVDLAPQDDARIEKTAERLFGEAAAAPDAFYGRSRRSLERIVATLRRWNERGRHAAAFARLQQKLDSVCAGLPDADTSRAGCKDLLRKPVAVTTG